MSSLLIYLLIFLIFFVDIITKGFIHRFVICFFMALPLFIKDCIQRDKSVFPGYGFWAFCGLGGSGKTLSIVDYLILMKERYPRVKIYTNFYFSGADGKIEGWKDLISKTNINILEIDEKEYEKRTKWAQNNVFMVLDENNNISYRKKVNDGIIFGFDEIHLTFESTKWQDAPSNLLDYISQQRKLHKQIVSSSQVFTRIDKKLREQTNFVVECRSILGGRLVINSYYNTVEYIANGEKMDKGNRKRKCKKREVFIGYDKIRSQYDTSELMKNLEKGKSNEKTLIDIMKKISQEDV